MPNKYPKISVFWNGTHKNRGKKKEWTGDDVRTIFQNTLAQAEDRIPFTIDHPDNDLPVIGWTSKDKLTLLEEGDRVTIQAEPTEFSEAVLDAVKSSGRKKVSVALRGSDLSIRHIGLVEKPAVTDLPAIPFNDEEQEIVFCEADEPLVEDAPLPVEEPTQNDELPIINEGGDMPNTDTTPDATFQAEMDALKAERDAMAKRLAAIEAEKRALEFSAYLDSEELKTRVTPAMKPGLLRLMQVLDGQEEYTFSEDGKDVKKQPLDELRGLLTTLPEQVQFGRHDQEPAGVTDGVDDDFINKFNEKRTK